MRQLNPCFSSEWRSQLLWTPLKHHVLGLTCIYFFDRELILSVWQWCSILTGALQTTIYIINIPPTHALQYFPSCTHSSWLTDSFAAETSLHCLCSHLQLLQCTARWGWQWWNWAQVSLVPLQHPVPATSEERQEKNHWINNSTQEECGLWQIRSA